MHKYLMVFTLIIGIIFLNSCDSIKMILNPNDYIKKDYPREKEYIYDTIVISNFGGNVIAGESKPKKQLIFSKIGQSYSFSNGETIEIVLDNIDASFTTFDIETDENTKAITLTLVDKEYSKVKLSKKCQSIIRTGINYIPKVELAEGLDPEQIIITPIFDDDCKKIGYQFRYGSIERGCRDSETNSIYKKFIECAGGRITSPNSKKIPISRECLIKRRMGFPCK